MVEQNQLETDKLKAEYAFNMKTFEQVNLALKTENLELKNAVEKKEKLLQKQKFMQSVPNPDVLKKEQKIQQAEKELEAKNLKISQMKSEMEV